MENFSQKKSKIPLLDLLGFFFCHQVMKIFHQKHLGNGNSMALDRGLDQQTNVGGCCSS
jgi:hypothetical protein